MNTWFSVHKNEQFLEDYYVQMNIIGYGKKNSKRELVSHSHYFYIEPKKLSPGLVFVNIQISVASN